MFWVQEWLPGYKDSRTPFMGDEPGVAAGSPFPFRLPRCVLVQTNRAGYD